MNIFPTHIPLYNRYGLNIYLDLTSVEESGIIGVYHLNLDPKCNYVSAGGDAIELDFVDPEGGPFIEKGMRMGEYTVNEIKIVDKQYVITLGV